MISQYKLGKLSEKKEELGELRKNFLEKARLSEKKERISKEKEELLRIS